MKQFLALVTICASALTIALGATQAFAAPDEPQITVDRTAETLKGNICTTSGGATFTFHSDGHYAYAGLGRTHSGHYLVGASAVTVLLDNGLGRSFAVSRKADVLYMEATAIHCQAAPEAFEISAGHPH